MLKKYLPLLFILNAHFINAQSGDSFPKKERLAQTQPTVSDTPKKVIITRDSAFLVELNKKLDEVKNMLEVQNEKDILATFYLKANTVKVKGKDEPIDHAEIFVENGMVKVARIYTKDNVIYETKRKKLVHWFELGQLGDTLKFYELNSDIPLFSFSSIINYVSELDKTNYLPADELIKLFPGKEGTKITIGTDLNSLIDFRIYTDLLSLLNKEGNGLVQSELSSKIVYNPIPLNGNFFIFNYIEPSFKFSKFDNRFKNQVVTDTIAPYHVDRLKLNQYAYIDLGFRFNLMKSTSFQHTLDILNIGVDFKYSDIFIQNINTTKTLNMAAFYIESRGQFLKYKNFGFEYGVQGYFQKIQNSSISAYNYWDSYLIYDFSLFYHPKDNPSNMIFARFKNFQSGLGNDFYSLLQFGYKTRFNFKNNKN